MIKQPILGPMLSTAGVSNEAQQSDATSRQSLPKEANGFAKLFVIEANAQKVGDGKVGDGKSMPLKSLDSEIHLPHEKLEKMTSQVIDEQAIGDLDKSAVLQQINQKIAEMKADSSSTEKSSKLISMPTEGDQAKESLVDSHIPLVPVEESQAQGLQVMVDGVVNPVNVSRPETVKKVAASVETSADTDLIMEGERHLDKASTSLDTPVQVDGNVIETAQKHPKTVDTELPLQTQRNKEVLQQAEQQVVQKAVNEKQAMPTQSVSAAQSASSQVSSQQQVAPPSQASVQSSPSQNMATVSGHSSSEQGSGQQGQQGQPSQQQQLQQQAQAFSQLQKQDVARVQQEGVKAFNDALVSEEAKTEKSEKLLGSMGLTLDGRNQLPPGLQTLSHPMRSPQWGQALGQRITYMANNKVQEAKITLNPEKLGTIQIKLNIDKDNQLHVSMSAQQGTTREAIENAMPRLKEILDVAGIGLGSLNVRDESAFANNQNQDASEGSGQATPNGHLTDASDDTEDAQQPELASNYLVDYYA